MQGFSTLTIHATNIIDYRPARGWQSFSLNFALPMLRRKPSILLSPQRNILFK